MALVEERDACGVGFISVPAAKASNAVVSKALTALGCMEHRGACGADCDSGDGAGVMTAIPWGLYEDEDPSLLALPRKNRAVGFAFLPQSEELAGAARAAIEAAIEARDGVRLHGWRVMPVDPDALGALALANVPRMEQFMLAGTDESRSYEDFERSLYLLRRSIPQTVGGEPLYLPSLSSRTIVHKGMVRSSVLGRFYKDLADPRFVTPFAIYHRRFSTNTMPKWPLAQPMRMLGHNGEINTLLGNLNWARARAANQANASPNECVIDDLLAGKKEAMFNCDLQDVEGLAPLVDPGNSDSANLDGVFENLVQSGLKPMEALLLLVPEAYQNQPDLPKGADVSAFYDYWAGVHEAWDGPALLMFSDGRFVGAKLDRNGLRPARYMRLRDGTVMVMSETGVVPGVDQADVLEKGRLGPGQMLAVDLGENVGEEGAEDTARFYSHAELLTQVAEARPYRELLDAQRQPLPRLPFGETPAFDASELVRAQVHFGWGSEDVDLLIRDMATTGVEATFCMGDDSPLAALSTLPRVLYDYFKQRFAQVTNPAIDPLREGLSMSLDVTLGARPPGADTAEQMALTPNTLLSLPSPVLNGAEVQAIKATGVPVATLSTLYACGVDGCAVDSSIAGPVGLEAAVKALCADAIELVRSGSAEVLILSDLEYGGEAGGPAPSEETLTYVPPLLAVGAVHHALIDAGLRLSTSLVAETAQAWSTHHVACLVGFGAAAVHPYLAYESVTAWHGSKRTQVQMKEGLLPSISLDDALVNYRKSLDKGLLKILSKIGISLLSSYMGAQIFEAIGISEDLIALGFRGTPSRIGGITVEELQREVAMFHDRAFMGDGADRLEDYGLVKFRPRGEFHHNSPSLTKLLHKAIDLDLKSRNKDTVKGTGEAVPLPVRTADEEAAKEKARGSAWDAFSQSLADRPITSIRDLLDISSDRKPIPLDEVEPVEAIMSKFCTGGMSLGALSREAHETLAIAMNRFGGKSNCGEGGEDPARFTPFDDIDEATGRSASFPHLRSLRKGDSASSRIKQIASGRFGVTPNYLALASQLEIKLAQGAKPGEGGQLPGPKIDEYIAGMRASKPGVTLISPPPHHDIYSIEDLAQLIYDLKSVNPRALVSVKLVSTVGIGTVAAGVAKCNADVIQVSGFDGGTGASPLSSIKHAGGPWELGLSEVHRTLVDSGLRSRTLLRVDGGLKNGWDVVIGALLGGEEYGFGTIAMIAEGCIMARVCHTNTCPVGLTTQQVRLRDKFPGSPDNVVHFFEHIAQEVRGLLASLGYTSLDELIGRADLLVQKDVALVKTAGMDTDFITNLPDATDRPTQAAWLDHNGGEPRPVESDAGRGPGAPHKDDKTLADSPELAAAIEAGRGDVELSLPIINTDRAVNTRLAGAVALKHGNHGYEGTMRFKYTGSAGQSFGAFHVTGMETTLEGEANDYLAKGMAGGVLALVPPPATRFVARDNVILGNTALYGATAGKLYANGRGGERFAVRNSGATTVVEGTGDHSCEYMTGGVVVVLGPIGRNACAGMTGGLAFFYDDGEMHAGAADRGGDFAPVDGSDAFLARLNSDTCAAQRVMSAAGGERLKGLLEEHVRYTGSPRAAALLADWAAALPRFWMVVPPSEKRSPEALDDAAEAAAASGSVEGVSADAVPVSR